MLPNRVTRPSFEQLLPYVNNTNPLNYQSGNPALSPAVTTTLDGNYSRFPQQPGYWAGSLNFTADATLPQKFSLLIRSELTTPQPLPQGYSNNIKGIDLEFRRLFWHNRLTAALLVSDLFNDRQETSRIQTRLFSQYEHYKEDARMLHLHLSYRF